MPIYSKTEVFYLSLPVLHAIGAVLSLTLSFACDTGKGTQTARIPRALPPPPSLSDDGAFLAAYPWDQDAEFTTHTWNPFALVFVFEWLTAAFALRPLVYFMERPSSVVAKIRLAWLFVGLILYLAWTWYNTGGVCVAMLCTVVVSFVASAALCVFDLVALDGYSLTAVAPKTALPAESYLDPHSGRVWVIPQRLLRRRCLPAEGHSLLQGDGDTTKQGENESTKGIDHEFENLYGVVLRYAEYCITAPLLFLAVVCLLTADGPAWLFLSGYWLLVVCNALGIALHISFALSGPSTPSENGGPLTWLFGLFFVGPWSSPEANKMALLQAAWVCLLVPMGGLVFLSREFLFSRDMPTLALFMIWNLLVTYSLFGIIPTFIYVTRWGKNSIAWLLDILNLSAKFPLPLVILSGFIMRPASTRFCYN